MSSDVETAQKVATAAVAALNEAWPAGGWAWISAPQTMPPIIASSGESPAGDGVAMYVREDGSAWGSAVIDGVAEIVEAEGASAVELVRTLIGETTGWRAQG